MRTIKFRGQHWKTGEWEYGYYCVTNEGDHLIGTVDILSQDMSICDLLFTQVNPETVGQFTGLHDKDGKEIYEGDVIDVCNGSINGVPWMDQSPHVVRWRGYGSYDTCRFLRAKDGSDLSDSTHWRQIVGNIHDNPELMKGAK